MTPRSCSSTTIFFCIIFSLFHGASSITITAASNGNVILQTGVKGQIDEILWKHNGNKMVEWDKSVADPIDYLTFKGRTKLDKKTCDVTIVDLTKNDSGLYEAEVAIQGKLTIISHRVDVIDPVTRAKVTCQRSNATMATLHCEAEGDFLSFSWSGSGLQTEMRGQTGPQINKEKDQDSVYICVVNNQVSGSSVHFHGSDCFDSGHLQLIGVCSAVIVVAAAAAGFGYHCYKKSTGQTKLDKKTGDLAKDDSGHYEAEVAQGRLNIKSCSVDVIDERGPTQNGEEREQTSDSTGASSVPITAATNGSVTLQPRVEGQIDEILWEHEGNKMVEWDSTAEYPTEYFKGRTKLDKKTGDVTIVKLTKDDSGHYEAKVAIQGRLKIISYGVDVIVKKEPTQNGEEKEQPSGSTGASSNIITAASNGSVILHARVKGQINKILWKCNGYKMVEWDGTAKDPTEYRTFKGRTKLDKQTGDVTIADLTKNDSGHYEAEVAIQGSSNRPIIGYSIDVIGPNRNGEQKEQTSGSTGQKDAGNENKCETKEKDEREPLLQGRDDAQGKRGHDGESRTPLPSSKIPKGNTERVKQRWLSKIISTKVNTGQSKGHDATNPQTCHQPR